MKTIVHVIDSLARGGAETLLINILPELSKHYNIVLVTLSDRNEFGDYVFDFCTAHYCLHHRGYASLPRTIFKLNALIRKYQPVLVRSDLIWSTIITRLACPKRIPLVFAVHITMDVFAETRLGPALAFAEKITTSTRQIMIGVTQEVVDGYKKKFAFKGRSFVLYNYVNDSFFQEHVPRPRSGQLRLIAVGNLRAQKNYQLVIDAFKRITGVDASIDIYGEGSLRQVLQQQIDEHRLPISLKGQSAAVHEVIHNYDVFLMVSLFEGFGIVVAEAMAAGLPLILSDLPVFREVTANNAFFVSLHQPYELADLLTSLSGRNVFGQEQVNANRQIAFEKYTKASYVKNTLHIYRQTILQNEN